MTRFFLTAAVIVCALLTACAAREPARPIVIQGAMDVEIRKLAGLVENVTEEKVGGCRRPVFPPARAARSGSTHRAL